MNQAVYLLRHTSVTAVIDHIILPYYITRKFLFFLISYTTLRVERHISLMSNLVVSKPITIHLTGENAGG
jgi:hypothetical protein